MLLLVLGISKYMQAICSLTLEEFDSSKGSTVVKVEGQCCQMFFLAACASACASGGTAGVSSGSHASKKKRVCHNFWWYSPSLLSACQHVWWYSLSLLPFPSHSFLPLPLPLPLQPSEVKRVALGRAVVRPHTYPCRLLTARRPMRRLARVHHGRRRAVSTRMQGPDGREGMG